MFYRLILISIFFTACDSKKINKNEIMGLWTDGSSSSPSFEINKDSLISFQHFGSYRYEIIGDTIELPWESANILGYRHGVIKITLKEDSLFFHFSDEKKKYWRVR